MTIFIGGAWPYANGDLHVGHISSLLPGDILARYYRQTGQDVAYVSGSDCNGTPILLRAKSDGVTVAEVANRYHERFVDVFERLHFSYDYYTRTDAEHHHCYTQQLFRELYESGALIPKQEAQCYCPHCTQFLADRFVHGNCPTCGTAARGDQCESCATMLEAVQLHEARCAVCQTSVEIRETEQLYLQLSRFAEPLAKLAQSPSWRANAIALTKRYLAEGLPDRAATRDLPNGIAVPIAGFTTKKIYVWIEAVTGYASALAQVAAAADVTTAIYVHGKDNIPFHTIIWPALLFATKKETLLPTHIVSNEYVTIERQKISTSRNWAIWAHDLLTHYEADTIRYCLTVNAPEQRDGDFAEQELIQRHNRELLGSFGNFVQRTFKFAEKYWPAERLLLQEDVRPLIEAAYDEVGQSLQAGSTKQALQRVFTLVHAANKYYDDEQPWQTVKRDEALAKRTIGNCLTIITNLAQLVAPFLPETAERLRVYFSAASLTWTYQVPCYNATPSTPLFKRIEHEKMIHIG